MLKPTKILVPTDFSEYSDKALQQALDIAMQYKAKVYVLHVIHDTLRQTILEDGEHLAINARDIKTLDKQLMKTVQQKLQTQTDKFPQSKQVEVIGAATKGLPYESILQYAKKKGINLIVIASLGNSGIAKYFLGSVARNVLKGSRCPVLLTK